MDSQQIYIHQECNIKVKTNILKIIKKNIFFLFSVALLGPTIDTATGLQLQQATAYTTLPAQYPIYAPTAIYSHLPTTTLIPSALASPGKDGLIK